MRILYITLENISFHKGSVVHIKEIISGLQSLGHYIGLIACSKKKFEKANSFYNLHKSLGVKKQSYFISSILLFIYLFKVLPHYDVIYARDFHTVIIAFLPRLILGKQLVFEINGLANEEQRLKGNSFFIRFFALLINMTERIAVRCSNQIISVTPQIASYLKVHFNCSQKRIKVVNNGVNTKIFRPIYDEDFLEIWKNKLGITREDKVIGFVGNLALWQGVHILIESASHILSKKIKLKVLIIGDGPLKKSLMKKAFDSGFYKNFIFTGMVDYEAVPIFINIADIGVAPFISRRNIETGVSPLKVFEYMACGKPVVASRIEGLEFVETDGAGWLIEPENKKQLEEALFDLIMDNQKRIHMGSKGLQIAHNKLAWDSRVIHIEKILKELA